MKAKICILLGLIGMLNISQVAFAHIDSKSTSQKPMYREITLNAGPRVAYGVDVFVTADFIWWKTKQAGLVYGATGIFVNTPATVAQAFDSLPKGRDAEVKYDWDPGFKVGLGLNFWHDGWDVYAEYTWLHTRGSNSISRFQGVLPSTFLPPNVLVGEQLQANSANSQAHLHFNVIDFELARNFYLSQFLMMRPHIGFKGTWQRHDWKTRYFGPGEFAININDNNSISLTGPYRLRHRGYYYGVGIRGGFDTAWHFTTNWSIFGDLAWTAMWSRYRLKRTDVVTDNNSGQKRQNVNIRSNFFDLKYIGELQIGLRWETWFSDDRYHIQIQAGWEEQIWINHMKFIDIILPEPYYDLTMHGLTVMVRFDF